MCLGIAEIDQQTITEELGNMPIVALNNFSTHLLIRPYHVPVLFGIELGGQLGGIDQVTKHHGQLSAFSFWSRRLGGSRFSWSRLVWLECFLLSQLRGSRCRLCCGFANPNKSFAVVIDNRMHV